MKGEGQLADIMRRLDRLEGIRVWRTGLMNAVAGGLLLVRAGNWPCPRLLRYEPAMDRYVYADPLLHAAYGPLPDNEPTDDYDFIEIP